MTKKETLHRLIKNNTPGNPVPFHPILMHFAARFYGATYSEFASDYKTLVDANMKCLEYFNHDAASLISDPYRETSAFGAVVEYPEDSVPRCREHIIRSAGDVKSLKNPDVYKDVRTMDRINGALYYKEILGDSLPVIGWIEGPLAEACDLAGVNEILLKIALEPDFVDMLMEKCLITAKDFAKAQIDAGCDIIGVGDAICSQISADMYCKSVLPLHKELFEFIHSCGAAVKLHICGDITHLLPGLANVGADILDIDWMVDFEEAYSHLGASTIVCGNLDPVSVIQDLPAEEVYEKSADLVDRFGDKKFILSGGCEITVNTPHENLSAMRGVPPRH
ncbi:uroporphyrinogen decarboxylase family protein [Candidatus Latescibacterota bacterium]